MSQILNMKSGGGGGGGIITIDGDIGSATGSTITFTAKPNAGASASFDATGDTVTLNATDSNFNTVWGANAGGTVALLGTSTYNCVFGNNAGEILGNNTCENNLLIGAGAGNTLGAGGSCNFNTFVGSGAGLNSGGGASNNNTAIGQNAGFYLGNRSSCVQNTLVGSLSGVNYDGTLGPENNNICLGYNVIGVTGESSIIRIGNNLNIAAYIQGIYGNNPSSPQMVTINASGQMGSRALPSSGNSLIGFTTNNEAFTSFYSPFGTGESVEIYAQYVMPVSGSINNLFINVILNSSTTDAALTLNVNGAASAMTLTITALTTGVFSYTASAISITSSDLIDFELSGLTTGGILGLVSAIFTSS